MTFTDSELRDALRGEYAWLCHDDFNPDTDMTEEQYSDYLLTLTREQLLSEINLDSDDDDFTLADFIYAYS